MPFSIGIDPGSQGAICLLDPSSKLIVFHDTPGKKTTIEEVYRFLWEAPNIRLPAGVEQVRSLPGMSAKSNFSFGYNVAQIETILDVVGIPFERVLPKEWQKSCGIVYPKKAPSVIRKRLTAQRALKLYPDAELYGPRGGLKDGRADALMIAHYMSQQGN